jgi:hypothetical protein
MPKNSGDYEVGFGRPPRAHQFRKGQSGNPKGRPKGAKNIASMFHEAINQKVKIKDQAGTRYVTKLEAAFTQLTNKAATGDLKALRDVIRLAQSLPADPKFLGPAPQFVVRFIEAEDGRPKYPEDLEGEGGGT